MSERSRSAAVVVTGYTIWNGLGSDATSVRRALANGTSGLLRPSLSLPFDTVTGEVRDALPELPAAHRSFESRIARLALGLYDGIHDTVARATARYGSDRVAILLGSSTGGLDRTEAFLSSRREGTSITVPYEIDRQHAFHGVVDLIARLSGVSGPRYCTSTACTSSAKVFASAKRLIETGLVDAAIVGGIDSLCATTLHGFHALGVLASEACRPFALGRDGMNIGEGGALVVLERDGDGTVALLGAGESSDAHHMSAPHPQGLGAEAAIRAALLDAGLDASDVDHVNAHGTGTPQNDSAEGLALARTLGTRVPTTSTKGYTGHLLGAAGATEAVFAMIAIEDGLVPASLGAVPIDPAIAIDVVGEARALRVRRVLSNSFAFGGNNVCLAFGSTR